MHEPGAPVVDRAVLFVRLFLGFRTAGSRATRRRRALKAFCQSANFFLNSSVLMPFAGEMRVAQSPTRRSSLPSQFTSSTQTRVACGGR